MNKILRVVVVLPAILFLVMGIRWVVAPAGIAPEFGMPLLEGVGLSTQVGDLGAFFAALAAFILIGVITQKRSWFYAASILLGLTAVFRALAWLLHGATFATDMILVEVVVTSLLLFAASRIPAEN
ncbi:MAG: hypothetical protein ACI9DH_000922 [Halioglobus sp.]|jgi:hypothetical protein